MKKRRLLFLVVNIIAILAALGSVFLPWWQGLRPPEIALSKILPFDFISHLSFSPNIVVVIFVGTAIVLLGTLLALKSVVLTGAIINSLTILLCFLAFNIGWEPSQFGYGIYLLVASISINITTLFIPRRREEGKR